MKTETEKTGAGPDPALPVAMFAGRRVLVAEDNPVNQKIALRLLEKMGCMAEAADDGRQAVDLHLCAHFDLILMDCEMPELDGYRATELIRSLESGLHIPVIALTAGSEDAERDRCLAAGMDDFLSKPLRAETLMDKLVQWLPAACAVENDQLEAVQRAFGDDFAELAQLYRADSPQRLALLRDAHAAGDHVRLGQVAHAFAGSCASIGARGLAALCRQLELAAKAGAVADLAPQLGAIEDEYRRIGEHLQMLLPSAPSAPPDATQAAAP